MITYEETTDEDIRFFIDVLFDSPPVKYGLE